LVYLNELNSQFYTEHITESKLQIEDIYDDNNYNCENNDDSNK